MRTFAGSRACKPLVPWPAARGRHGSVGPAGDQRGRLRLRAASGGARTVLRVLPDNLWARILGAGWRGQRVHVHVILLETATCPPLSSDPSHCHPRGAAAPASPQPQRPGAAGIRDECRPATCEPRDGDSRLLYHIVSKAEHLLTCLRDRVHFFMNLYF